MYGDPPIGGHFFITTISRAEFRSDGHAAVGRSTELLELVDDPAPPALYVGALTESAGLPGFARRQHVRPVDGLVPRIWLSNRVTVQTHYDLSYNLACVVAGRRRFTLFPPEQLANLYVGPLEFTLAGPAHEHGAAGCADHERFPRFRDALATGPVAELDPGDALFIPYMWWHHVDALDAVQRCW